MTIVMSADQSEFQMESSLIGEALQPILKKHFENFSASQWYMLTAHNYDSSVSASLADLLTDIVQMLATVVLRKLNPEGWHTKGLDTALEDLNKLQGDFLTNEFANALQIPVERCKRAEELTALVRSEVSEKVQSFAGNAIDCSALPTKPAVFVKGSLSSAQTLQKMVQCAGQCLSELNLQSLCYWHKDKTLNSEKHVSSQSIRSNMSATEAAEAVTDILTKWSNIMFNIASEETISDELDVGSVGPFSMCEAINLAEIISVKTVISSDESDIRSDKPDVGSDERIGEREPNSSDEIISVKSDVGIDKTISDEVDISVRSDKTISDETDVRSEQTISDEAAARSHKAISAEPDVTSDKTISDEADVRSGKITVYEPDVRSDKTISDEADRSYKPILDEADVRSDKTISDEADRSYKPILDEADVRSDKTISDEADRLYKPILDEADVRSDKTISDEADRSYKPILDESDVRSDKTISEDPDISSEWTILDVADIRSDKTIWDEPDVGSDKTLSDEPDVRSDKTISDEPDIRLDKMILDRKDVKSDKAILDKPDRSDKTISDEPDRSDQTISDEPDIRSDYVIFDEPDIGSERTISDETDVRSDKRFLDEPNVRSDNTISDEPDVRSDKTISDEPDVRSDKTIEDELDVSSDKTYVRLDKTISDETDVRSDKTISDEMDFRSQKTVSEEPDVKSSKTISDETDVTSDKTISDETDIRSDETVSNGTDMASNKTVLERPDARSDKTISDEPDIRSDKTISDETYVGSDKNQKRIRTNPDTNGDYLVSIKMFLAAQDAAADIISEIWNNLPPEENSSTFSPGSRETSSCFYAATTFEKVRAFFDAVAKPFGNITCDSEVLDNNIFPAFVQKLFDKMVTNLKTSLKEDNSPFLLPQLQLKESPNIRRTHGKREKPKKTSTVLEAPIVFDAIEKLQSIKSNDEVMKFSKHLVEKVYDHLMPADDHSLMSCDVMYVMTEDAVGKFMQQVQLWMENKSSEKTHRYEAVAGAMAEIDELISKIVTSSTESSSTATNDKIGCEDDMRCPEEVVNRVITSFCEKLITSLLRPSEPTTDVQYIIKRLSYMVQEGMHFSNLAIKKLEKKSKNVTVAVIKSLHTEFGSQSNLLEAVTSHDTHFDEAVIENLHTQLCYLQNIQRSGISQWFFTLKKGIVKLIRRLC